ncbi:hypothetical protein [Nakamurella leprariae]|uniref:Uncharacterized protein n=1 Tax=Nakamurella leprariae TaxID=2803911 RepID=A0A939BW80_9ACTN|nr:hypothetical protein [Nakamurella leprariae]MBM9467273.1 hypothetical protein [Nakamurella leprariae]
MTGYETTLRVVLLAASGVAFVLTAVVTAPRLRKTHPARLPRSEVLGRGGLLAVIFGVGLGAFSVLQDWPDVIRLGVLLTGTAWVIAAAVFAWVDRSDTGRVPPSKR